MPVDPFLQAFLSTFPPSPEVIEDYDAYRAASEAGAEVLADQVINPGPEVMSRRAVSLPVAGGTIDLLVYVPFTLGPHAAHLFLHGGGWMAGTIHQKFIDAVCRERCVGADCVVVAVNYRKAPEHKFPIPLNDCAAALDWVVANASELNINSSCITISGQSAGANLAAALTLKTRDEGGPRLAFQVLEVPPTDLTKGHLRYECASGYGLSLKDAELCVGAYLRSPEDASNPYASPLLAPDLSGLPPALILTSEYDILRDDGEAYATRLKAEGVPVTYAMYEGHIHGSSAFTKVIASAHAWQGQVIAALLAVHQGCQVVQVPIGS
ncbi:alpha/beta hydrolase [Deinococcus sp. KSM4-11]|uniref:alpha/beta hydrolase n=1 Tax=Deinococcus sp. KSM4-11 TaxID=2568654 RepID=UPI0010A2BB4B|nr:alpha/beta hydrolase [Deinococcus sp. KSM4-11]THF85487.1 alpha/beta hydrolase [Deinococcus sp. KSM4-11]